MIYNDGYETDNNLRFVHCPRCGNEEYSQEARFCRICGLPVYNECEGIYDQDEGMYQIHRNPGNARYCEFCGQPTMLLKEKLLKPYTAVNANTNDESSIRDEDEFPF